MLSQKGLFAGEQSLFFAYFFFEMSAFIICQSVDKWLNFLLLNHLSLPRTMLLHNLLSDALFLEGYD